MTASFDFACTNTSLHHMDFAAALAAMARALRPGGRLAVVGLAAHGSFGDYLADAPGIPVGLAYRAVRGKKTAACLSTSYSPTSAGVPLVMRMSSAWEVGKTVCGWPPAAQISSYLSSQVSTRVLIGLGWPTGATPPMA